MTRVGVIGLGMMGATHLDAYTKLENVKVTAIADLNQDLLNGNQTVEGNIEGQAQGGFNFNDPELKKYTDGMTLIADPDIDVVDICLITPLHLKFALAALEAGKHVLVEKPFARTYADAQKLQQAGEQASTILMCAMCMRFWPAWAWLKQAADENRYGKILSATFKRVGPHPAGDFYANGKLCGGGILDLHIHDTDFVQHLFGLPKAVTSVGYTKETDHIDHVHTQYHYDDGPVVTAEGGWAMAQGTPFKMQYCVNFEKATALFDIGESDQLTLSQNGTSKPIQVDEQMGYLHEIAYFIKCVQSGQKPTIVTLADAANAVRIVEAEVQSIATGKRVSLS